jgi:mannose-6-phosphate isomerase
LVTQNGRDIFGRHRSQDQFPLLLKFLDCQKTLSVQVHPNDEQGAKLNPPDLGKTEAWVVLAADPGSKIYAGLKRGVDRQTLERAVEQGNCDVCLHEFEPRVGDCVLIEAGTVHAIGAGLLIAEIQQASDTTFRLYDWNRVDRDGKPRELHIEQALEVTNYERGPVNSVKPKPTSNPNSERLVQCDKFVLDRLELSAPHTLPNDDRFHILAVIEGDCLVRNTDEHFNLRRGETILIPATTRDICLSPPSEAVVLDMYLP